jgi:hypothetical protein
MARGPDHESRFARTCANLAHSVPAPTLSFGDCLQFRLDLPGQAVGQMPGDVAVEQQVISGRPAGELAILAWGGDLLVLGSRHRGWLRRLAPGSVARACARRAARS